MKRLIFTYQWGCQIILFFVFTFSVFVDMYNGYCQHYMNFSPLFPSVYKGGLLLVCVLSCLVGRWTSFFKGLLFILFFYTLAWYYWMICIPYFNPIEELNYIIKFSFPYFILAFLFQYRRYIRIDKFIRILTYYGVIAAFSIILLFYLGLGVNSYGEIDTAYGFGTKGFFTAGNDIGLVLLMTNCLLCYLYVSTHELKYLLEIMCVTVGTIMLGTMAGIGGTLLIWCILIGFILFISKNLLTLKQKVVLTCFVSVTLVCIISNIIDIFINDTHMWQRFEILSMGGSRTGLKVAANQVFDNFDGIQWLLGRGYTGFAKGIAMNRSMEGYRLTEMDFHDVIGYYGLLIGGMVILFSFYFLYLSIKYYLKNYRSAFYFWGIVLLCLFIGHGYLAGHAYTSTQSSLLFVGVAFIIFCKKDECYIK